MVNAISAGQLFSFCLKFSYTLTLPCTLYDIPWDFQEGLAVHSSLKTHCGRATWSESIIFSVCFHSTMPTHASHPGNGECTSWRLAYRNSIYNRDCFFSEFPSFLLLFMSDKIGPIKGVLIVPLFHSWHAMGFAPPAGKKTSSWPCH